MLAIPLSLQTRFEIYLRTRNVPKNTSAFYIKWLRYYLDFCHKYHAVPTRRESLSLFLGKLQEKKQTKAQQRQASDAVSLYYELLQYPEPQGNAHTPAKVSLSEKSATVSPLPAVTSPNQTNITNGADFPRKTYPESSSPSVDSVNEPPPKQAPPGRRNMLGWKLKSRFDITLRRP